MAMSTLIWQAVFACAGGPLAQLKMHRRSGHFAVLMASDANCHDAPAQGEPTPTGFTRESTFRALSAFWCLIVVAGQRWRKWSTGLMWVLVLVLVPALVLWVLVVVVIVVAVPLLPRPSCC